METKYKGLKKADILDILYQRDKEIEYIHKSIKRVCKDALTDKCEEAHPYVEDIYQALGWSISERVTLTIEVDLPFGLTNDLDVIVRDENYDEHEAAISKINDKLVSL